MYKLTGQSANPLARQLQQCTALQTGHLTITALSTWFAADILGSSDSDLCGFNIFTKESHQRYCGSPSPCGVIATEVATPLHVSPAH